MNKTLFPVVILAGGLQHGLRPLTRNIPKALVDINGEPFIAHQLRLLQKNGIQKVVLCARLFRRTNHGLCWRWQPIWFA